MEPRFRVVQVKGIPFFEQQDLDERSRELAANLRDEFGLYHLDVDRVLRSWKIYSKAQGKNWAEPDEHSVSMVYNVVLEEK